MLVDLDYDSGENVESDKYIGADMETNRGRICLKFQEICSLKRY